MHKVITGLVHKLSGIYWPEAIQQLVRRNIFEPLKAKLIIENRMRGCMEENYFLDQRKINRQIQL